MTRQSVFSLVEVDIRAKSSAEIATDRRAGTLFRGVPAGVVGRQLTPIRENATNPVEPRDRSTCADWVFEKTLSIAECPGVAFSTFSLGRGGGMKVVADLRVSTDRQAERGLGLDVQEQAVRRWARANGHRIVVWARDEGVSGSNGLENRMALPEAFAALRERKAAGIVVYRLDRLARDLVLQETLLAEIRRLRGCAFSTDGGEAGYLDDNPDEPSRRLIRQVLGAVAEYERGMIALRMRSGRRRKAELGGYASGAPPYGFRAEDGALVPDDAEQQVIRRIRELEAEGRPQREIADALNASGHRTKQGRAWNRVNVGLILRREGPGSEKVSASPPTAGSRARISRVEQQFLEGGESPA